MSLDDLPWDELETHFIPLVRLVQDIADKYELAPPQVQFLLFRPRFKTDTETMIGIGQTPSLLPRWFKNEWNYQGRRIEFKSAYYEYMDKMPDVSAQMMHHLLFKATERTSQMLDATKRLNAGKTDEGKTIYTNVPDWTAVGKAIELILRHEGRFEGGRTDNNVYDEFVTYLRKRNKELDETGLGDTKLLVEADRLPDNSVQQTDPRVVVGEPDSRQ